MLSIGSLIIIEGNYCCSYCLHSYLKLFDFRKRTNVCVAADELMYNAFSVATYLFPDNLNGLNIDLCIQQFQRFPMIQEYWSYDDISEVVETSRLCLLGLSVLRVSVRAKVENLALPIDFPDFTKYQYHFPQRDLNVQIPPKQLRLNQAQIGEHAFNFLFEVKELAEIYHKFYRLIVILTLNH